MITPATWSDLQRNLGRVATVDGKLQYLSDRAREPGMEGVCLALQARIRAVLSVEPGDKITLYSESSEKFRELAEPPETRFLFACHLESLALCHAVRASTCMDLEARQHHYETSSHLFKEAEALACQYGLEDTQLFARAWHHLVEALLRETTFAMHEEDAEEMLEHAGLAEQGFLALGVAKLVELARALQFYAVGLQDKALFEEGGDPEHLHRFKVALDRASQTITHDEFAPLKAFFAEYRDRLANL